MEGIEGKLALVTGGASGIGRAVCLQLAREGARVAVADINVAGAEETIAMLKNPGKHLAVQMDVTIKDSVMSGLDSARKVFGGPPTLLAHCAGIIQFCPTIDVTEEDFDKMVNVNLKGTFLVTQAVGKALREAQIKEGSLVCISSLVVYETGSYYGHYAAAKAGVISLTKSFAMELAGDGVRVNAILPGITDTSLFSKEALKALMEKYGSMIALGRIARPEEIANLILFLLSDRSSYITGAEIRIGGGAAM
ncbi:(3R)-3-hydroxyacyl-CoA dehydrogenase-like [Oratosquilla oratoria]|uniref:(3R)-3-hydroxyacyl-CoA dehydrogenase-like n=1 Tax=Oratosquilla oratoria TaxID=337810 RepID=UPI003F773A5C